VTSNPPTGEPEQRWQQPAFGPAPDEPVQPTYYPIGMGASLPARRVPPPSTMESVVGALAKVIWPVVILWVILGHGAFFPMLIVALVVSTLLGAVKKSLRQRRYAAALPPQPPIHPEDQR